MNSLQKMFYQFMNEYSNELAAAKQNNIYKRPFSALVTRDIKNAIQEKLDCSIYTASGSVGKGRWTDIPWIAVFDKRITKSAQKGVYIVYLLNKDTKTLYLTLNQGATDIAQNGDNGNGKLAFTGIASTTSTKSISALRERSSHLQKMLNKPKCATSDPIQTGSAAYDAGCIFSKGYTLDSLPEDEALYADLAAFVETYASYYTDVFQENSQESYDGDEKMDNGKSAIIQRISRYIDSKGFFYSDGLIQNFYLSLKAKPFVILAGTSGTGKTRLVKLFAESIGAEYMMVPVRPDWSDSSDLFGHVDLNGRFIPGAILDFISDAQKNMDKPHILCLDEMNLARVEYYLSDFLSIMETRELKDGHIVSDPLVSREKYGADKDAFEKYGELGLPENLYLVGTVNMDETTFSFSKKVLDRANTIEFNYVDLVPSDSDYETVEPMSLNNDFLKTEHLLLVECKGSDEFINDICVELQSINKILQNANAHIGYRVRDEIVFYMLNNMKSDLLSRDEAFDNEIMQKILPRIQGSSSSIRDVLCELFKVFAGDYDGYQLQNEVSAKMFERLKNADSKYPKSAEKIAFMTRRFEEDGFTSYWL